MIRTTCRRSRRVRRCDVCEDTLIRPGDHYLERAASPRHGDVGNERWMRWPECRACAEQYGRGHLLPEVTR